MSKADVHEVARRGFEAQVESYDKGRPDYPNDAVEEACAFGGLNTSSEERRRVLEVGAGTGKLTRTLVQYVDRRGIVAIEPADAMRAKFHENFADIEIMDAVVTKLPFEDGTFDAIFVGQAFHWFANEAALQEMARVLKVGGTLCLIWNLEDNSVEWVKRLRSLYEGKYDGDIPQFWKGLWRAVWKTPVAEMLFQTPVEKTYSHRVYVTESLVWDRLVSKSYIAILPKEEQQALKRQVEIVLKEELKGKTENIEYPQVTTVFLARKK